MSVNILNLSAVDGFSSIAEGSVDCIVTSPPYFGLRDYGHPGQIGQENTPEEYLDRICEVFSFAFRALKDSGSAWVNLGDSYNAEKSLFGIPWRFALEMMKRGWILRQDIVWEKPNPMPESVKDRCTRNHEYLFHFVKGPAYFWDQESMQEEGVIPAGSKGCKGSAKRSGEKGVSSRPPEYWEYNGKRNKRSVWNIKTKPFPGAHFAVFPPELPRLCIKASCPPGGMVLDPFAGSGTTGEVAEELGVNSILFEINPDYCEIIRKRTAQKGLFSGKSEAGVC